MSTCDISKYGWSISIFEHFMSKFHELPEQPSHVTLAIENSQYRALITGRDEDISKPIFDCAGKQNNQ